MSHEQFKGFMILSGLIATAGIVLMFVSISWGTALGDSWLSNKMYGMADTTQYNMVVKTYTNNFVIIGSILFATGLISAMFTYITSVLLRKNS